MEKRFLNKITPDLAEICGIHAGDGYLRCRNNKSFELDISGNIDEKEYYDTHVIPLFEKVFGIKIEPQFFKSRNTYGFRIYKKKVCETLNFFGFSYGKKTLTVNVPKQILESRNLDVIYKFLRGIFDTDGTISFKKRGGSGYSKVLKSRHTYPSIKIEICSKNLRDGIGLLLLKTGFQFSFADSKVNSKNENVSFALALEGDQNTILWMHNIGFKNPVKMNRFLIWKKFGFNPPLLTLSQQKRILLGEENPNNFYSDEIDTFDEIIPKLVKKRLRLIQTLDSLRPKD